MVDTYNSSPATGSDISMASMADIVRSTGMVLRRVRLARGLQQREPARLCGLGISDVCRIELGRRTPPLDRLIRLCTVLGVRPSEVLRMAEDEAFPLDSAPWTASPAELLLRAVPGALAMADLTVRNRPAGGGA
jgi:transcriptional regulator with XRE-family HTH domain